MFRGFAPASAWTSRLAFGYDAMGNVASIARSLTDGTNGVPLLNATYRNAGRPDSRTITTACGAADPVTCPAITRAYGYESGTGFMNAMSVTTNGIEVAGSRIGYDGVQIADARLLGISSDGRHNRYGYDERSRLQTAVSARPEGVVPNVERLSAADFRQALDRTRPTPADPPSLTFGEETGHKISSVTRDGETRTFTYKGAERRDDGRYLYTFDARKRLVKVEEKPAPQSLTLRRVLYYYSGTNRLVGRRAEYNVLATAGADPNDLDWKVEDRADILTADALPARVTFLWDPVADVIVAVYKAGASRMPGGVPVDAEGGLIRQIIHGGLGYDDPIEVTVAQTPIASSSETASAASLNSEKPSDPSSRARAGVREGRGTSGVTNDVDQPAPLSPRAGGRTGMRGASSSANDVDRNTATPLATPTLGHLYPVYDESASQTLQAVLNSDAELVSRNAADGAYGEDSYTLGGSAVDRVAMKAEKDTDGNLVSVDVTIRTTERIAEATLGDGVRLAVLDATGVVLRSTDATPTLFDNWTAQWHLTAEQWDALVSDDPNSPLAARPSSLSIAATSTLRASAWSTDLPILPAPDWALASRPVYASEALPVEARESLESLATWLDGIAAGSTGTRVVYEVESLGALGTLGGVEPPDDPAKLLVSAPFQAQPFLEPLTGQDYVRARWYDPSTGSWLSPDPVGYRDSSNLYAFVGGDPVNGRDPTGRFQADFHYGITMFLALRAGLNPRAARTIAYWAEAPDQNTETEPVSVTLQYLLEKAIVIVEAFAGRVQRGRGANEDARRHEAIARSVQDERERQVERLRRHHFPRSDNDPAHVAPMSKEAVAMVERGIAQKSVHIFGVGLHALQDSFSHEGSPSIAGVSGHSRESGGPLSKNADTPFTAAFAAKGAAENTYKYLLGIAESRPDLVRQPPAQWADVSNELDEFLSLILIREKKAWFEKREVIMPGDYWVDVSSMPMGRLEFGSAAIH